MKIPRMGRKWLSESYHAKLMAMSGLIVYYRNKSIHNLSNFLLQQFKKPPYTIQYKTVISKNNIRPTTALGCNCHSRVTHPKTDHVVPLQIRIPTTL